MRLTDSLQFGITIVGLTKGYVEINVMSMNTYTLKFYVTFTFDEEEVDVKGEKTVKDGTPFSYDDVDEIIDMIVENKDTAKDYIISLFEESEENVVDVPTEVSNKQFSTDLTITGVEVIR